MTWEEYATEVKRTIPNLTLEEMTRHGKLGLVAEVGEVHAIFQKVYQGKPVDPEKLKDELGDVVWFATEIAISAEATLSWPETEVTKVPDTLSSMAWVTGIISLQGNKEPYLRLNLNDVLRYVGNVALAYGWTFQEVIDYNVQKLRQRYPNGFQVK